MQIIKDDEMDGIMMIPFFTQHGISKCNVECCENRPYIALTGIEGIETPIGICKDHYKESESKGKWELKIKL
jgi:hypothetical protein